MGPKLKRLTLSNYRSFVDTSEVELPESGLVSLNGKNLDTGGGSGSGKSNFITAIAYLLGFSPLPYTDFQSWYTDKDPIIHGEFETSQGTFSIIRGKHFKLFMGEDEILGSAAQKEAKIDEVFGMPAEFRKLLTYRGQRQPGSFLSNTDSKKKEFLTQILGLDKFEAALEIGAKNVTRLEASLCSAYDMVGSLREVLKGFESTENLENLLSEVNGTEALLGTQKACLAKLKADLANLHKEIESETNVILSLTRSAHKQAMEAYGAFEADPLSVEVDNTEVDRLSKTVASCKDRIEALVKEDRAMKAGHDASARGLQQAIDSENAKINQIPGLEKQINRLRDEITKLEAGKCSVCERTWEESKVKAAALVLEKFDLETKVTEYQKSRAVVFQLQQQLEPFRNFEPNPKIAQMAQAKSDLEAKLATEKQKIDSLQAVCRSEKNTKQAELKAEASSLLAEGEKQARLRREARQPEAEAIGQKILFLNDDIALNQTEYNDLQRRITRAQYVEDQRKVYQPKLEDAADLATSYEVELKAEKDFLALIGREGFLGSIFDEILTEISDTTNAMLASVANTRHCSIEFKSESLTQKGTTTRSIVPVVSVSGHESTLKSGLSGGMMSVVELAVDLAVGRVIATRTGTCPGFLILDESLTGLGPVEKETSLELIQSYARDRLVLIVEHATEFNALFTKSILIEFSEGRSIVK